MFFGSCTTSPESWRADQPGTDRRQLRQGHHRQHDNRPVRRCATATGRTIGPDRTGHDDAQRHRQRDVQAIDQRVRRCRPARPKGLAVAPTVLAPELSTRSKRTYPALVDALRSIRGTCPARKGSHRRVPWIMPAGEGCFPDIPIAVGMCRCCANTDQPSTLWWSGPRNVPASPLSTCRGFRPDTMPVNLSRCAGSNRRTIGRRRRGLVGGLHPQRGRAAGHRRTGPRCIELKVRHTVRFGFRGRRVMV